MDTDPANPTTIPTDQSSTTPAQVSVCSDNGCTTPACPADGCRGTACTVEAVMTKQVVTVSMDHTVAQVRELFMRHGFHHLLVIDHGHAAGLISDRDLLKNLSPFVGTRAERSQDAFCLQRKAHQIMTRKLIWVPPETPIQDAITLLLAHGLTCLPVLDEYLHVMGIVTWRDLLRAALHEGVEPGPKHLPETREIQDPRAEHRLATLITPLPAHPGDDTPGGASLRIAR